MKQISPSKSHTPTPNLIVESTSLLVNKKFSGFKSRWVTLTAVVMLLNHDHEIEDYADPGCPNKKRLQSVIWLEFVFCSHEDLSKCLM